MLENNIHDINQWAQSYIARLAPAQQKKLLMQMGRVLRQQNQQRIQAQQTPDGQAWAARKKVGGKAVRRKMFKKLRSNRHFKIRVQAHALRVGFDGSAARIARIHHEGLTETKKGTAVTFAQRKLIGITPLDQQALYDALLNHLSQS